MPPDSRSSVGQYSPGVGLIFVFNLIVGTGALTMPGAFNAAGWILSLGLIVVLALMSYITATFVIEAMASANAVIRIDKQKTVQSDVSTNNGEEESLLHSGRIRSLPQMFDITKKVEMGQMSSLFFNKTGVILFYIAMVAYLYGDLAIYAAAVPKSLRDVACTYRDASIACNETIPQSIPCWKSIPYISRYDAYRIFLTLFVVLLCPFVFFNITKMKYMQIFTAIIRWLSFVSMIVIACNRLSSNTVHVAKFNIRGIPTLFGICVYSFMCHHSLPSIATPITDKSRIHFLFAADYTLILAFYALLSMTGVFAFKDIEDLYTLNFEPHPCGELPSDAGQIPAVIGYFLALFPVFALSSNFPMIGITLRENLKTLFARDSSRYPWIIDRIVFPIAALAPPITVAYATNDIGALVAVTGSYAGGMIQYVVPAALVYCARKQLGQRSLANASKSPFFSNGWVFFVLAWAAVCLCAVTASHIIELRK